jgi:predicted transcriptional regulator
MPYSMISSKQIRAARALLGWRQVDLAAASGVATITIKEVEKGATDPRSSTLTKLEAALVAAGVQFIDGGVRQVAL